tara:strand:+ start:856 stop:987 length:132 start_codon:yes stop_codon:yes gene_type:complete
MYIYIFQGRREEGKGVEVPEEEPRIKLKVIRRMEGRTRFGDRK